MRFFDSRKVLPILSRIFLGGIFLIFGMDGYYNFLPLNRPSPQGGAFLLALKESGYFFYFLKGLEITCGLMLIANFFVPLTMLILTPILINIVLYGIFLDPKTLPLSFLLCLAQGHLFYYFRDLFKIFLKYQFYTAPDTEGKAHVMVLEEIKEKYPQVYQSLYDKVLKEKEIGDHHGDHHRDINTKSVS